MTVRHPTNRERIFRFHRYRGTHDDYDVAILSTSLDDNHFLSPTR